MLQTMVNDELERPAAGAPLQGMAQIPVKAVLTFGVDKRIEGTWAGMKGRTDGG